MRPTAPPAVSTLSSIAARSGLPAGQCVFGEDWTAARLVAKERCKETTVILTFELPDASKPLGLSTMRLHSGKIRPRRRGCGETLHAYLDERDDRAVRTLGEDLRPRRDEPVSRRTQIGDAVEFKHIPFNVKIQYPFKPKVGMLIGGTGIAPMIQALHAILGTADDTAGRLSMLYASKVEGGHIGAGNAGGLGREFRGSLHVQTRALQGT